MRTRHHVHTALGVALRPRCCPNGIGGLLHQQGFIAMQANAELSAVLPEKESPAGYPVYLIDPDGFVALHYPAGFDPSGLRKDLAKLVK